MKKFTHCLLTLILLAFTSIAAAQSPQKPPIKIGVLLPGSGPFAFIWKEGITSWKIYLDKINWEVAGRKIEVIFEDDKMDPGTGLMKAKKLVESDKVHVISGIVSSAVAYAIRPYVHGAGVPLLIGNAAADGLTLNPAMRSPYIFRSSYCNSQQYSPVVAYAYHNLGYRKMIFMAQDYAVGREGIDAAKKIWGAVGGNTIQEIFFPLGTTDFAPYFPRLKLSEADVLYILASGSDATNFSRQYVEYGLKIPLIGEGSYVDQAIIPAHTKGGILGTITADNWSNVLDIPENKYFTQEYLKRAGALPGKQAAVQYVACQVITSALKAIGGDIENLPKFLKSYARSKYS